MKQNPAVYYHILDRTLRKTFFFAGQTLSEEQMDELLKVQFSLCSRDINKSVLENARSKSTQQHTATVDS